MGAVLSLQGDRGKVVIYQSDHRHLEPTSAFSSDKYHHHHNEGNPKTKMSMFIFYKSKLLIFFNNI